MGFEKRRGLERRGWYFGEMQSGIERCRRERSELPVPLKEKNRGEKGIGKYGRGVTIWACMRLSLRRSLLQHDLDRIEEKTVGNMKSLLGRHGADASTVEVAETWCRSEMKKRPITRLHCGILEG